MIKFFINRPIFATVIAILIVLAGAVTLFSLPIAQFPNITPPTVQVSAMYPGAGAQTVAQTIGVPIEEQVNGVDGMIYMSSSSASDGSYSLTVTFDVGTDIDMATVLVQNRVNAAQSSLPEAVIQQGITIQKQSTDIVMFVSLISDNPQYDALYLSNYAQLNLVNQLSRVPGVGSVSVFGAGEYSIRIWMDPEKMKIRGLEPMDVYNAISAQNEEVSAGAVGAPPQSVYNDFQFSLTINGRLSSVEEFENIVLKTIDNGNYLRLKDVATVYLGSDSYNTVTQNKGLPNAAIAIYQLPDANALDVAKGVTAELSKLEKYLPTGVECEVTLNTTEFVNASIKEILKTFVETLLLVILVILLFLQSFRAMIIPVIVIPISIIGTFVFMKLLGFSINTLTLFGLVLAIAIVVDDAIVVVENAMRYFVPDKSGKPLDIKQRRAAVTAAMDEIVGPVVGIVLVLLSVFIPTAFVSGITGELYRQFALTIAVATLLSGIVSLLFTPAMCALFLTQSKTSNWFIFRWFNKFYNALLHFYLKCVKGLLNRKWMAVSIFFAVTILTGWMFITLPSSFIPEEDQGYFMISVQLPPAASLDRTVAVTTKLNAMLDKYPEIDSYITINGFSIMGGGVQPNGATVFVILKNWKERKGKGESSFDIVDDVNAEAASIEQAEIFAVSPPAISGLGASGGLQVEIEDINNYGTAELQRAVDDLFAVYRIIPQVVMLNSEFQANTPQYYLSINRDKIEMMGISISDFFNTLSAYMGSAYVNDYVEFGRIYEVKIEGDAASRNRIEDVLKLNVKNASGELVPFASFVTPIEQVGANNITRYNMYTAASVVAISNPMYSSRQAIDAMETLIIKTLGNNYGYEWTSVAYQQTQAGSSIYSILLLSLVITILVLSAQYESWLNPLAVLMGVPYAILGALIGTIGRGLSISIYTQIGIILLIALSAKNAILIVQFAMDYRAQGKSVKEAAMEAARVRLRPILMTSFAFILGVLPLMFASGAGAVSREYVGTAVVCGMLFNTLFATLFVPAFYSVMQKKNKSGA